MGLKPQSSIGNLTVEACAELCALEDAYLCRSFDFIAPTRTCNLFKENVKDKIYFNLNLQQNVDCNHYSSRLTYNSSISNKLKLKKKSQQIFKGIYYEENGVLKKIEAQRRSKSGTHGAGIFLFLILFRV